MIYFLDASGALDLLAWLYERRDVIWQMAHNEE
jgi:hypothetical protein